MVTDELVCRPQVLCGETEAVAVRHAEATPPGSG